MKLQALGCAGGIGGREALTTCFRIDNDILLDAGTGLTSLTMTEMAAIDHVFLTHCHLDHVAGLALLVDTTFGRRHTPLIVHATEQVIAPLKQHLFNWVLWPDFSALPDAENPVMRWEAMPHGTALELGGRHIVSHSSVHTDGSSAYAVTSGEDGFVFSGDTCSAPELWRAIAADKRIGSVIVDCSFPDADEALARLSNHFCPRTLLADIQAMPHSVEFLIYHLKPGQEDVIMQELQSGAAGRAIRALRAGEVLQF
jgi:3',5'-cyclic-nucleotide phosphodiesterase